ncbi:PRC-barrel domain containing protein [Paracoccus liaowanqingii]|uniref:PRC-barrel domain containing protein n=1 Tax=Paracoccus liaowanqingii TaxID=2560053 RepID=A0A4P7HJZ1_9RHOB|nr:PRC-barrel domain-containing protein [Paracoccus liaowanqingii]QBX34488.1 PRC-barrel domain containing protein [Paracoccus liaowanqingii]
MKTLMMTTAAALTLSTAAFAQTTTTEPMTTAPMATETMPAETMPAETMPADTMATDPMTTDTMATDATMDPAMAHEAIVPMSDTNPGISASWFQGKAIYTTNQPSTTAWDDNATWGTERPGDWNEIGTVSDVVLSGDGQVMGYIVDIGGFLGLGQHSVMLSPDVANLVDFDDNVLWGDDTVFATNYTQEELEALPQVEMDYILD